MGLDWAAARALFPVGADERALIYLLREWEAGMVTGAAELIASKRTPAAG